MHRFHGKHAPRGQRRVPQSKQFEGRFGRLFRKLRPCERYDEQQLKAAADSMIEPPPAEGVGGWGGPGAAPDGLDNEAIPAGYTYFGQFIDHDITFDPASSLQAKNDPDALTDFRTPRFDLDSLYGSGPNDEPFQYDGASGNTKFLIEQNTAGEADLPRNSQDIALIGDPRNDENVIVSQLQLVFLKLHNKLVDQLAGDGVAAERLFEEARRLVRWHYQWVVVDDYLRRLVGDEVVDERFSLGADGPKFNLQLYRPKREAYMPVEFSAAAFRFGHSQIRPAYNLNAEVLDRPIFLPGDVGPTEDLRGFRRLEAGWTLDWRLFLEIDGSTPQPSRKIDAKLAGALFRLPGSDERSLALRNLLRGEALALPRGQDVANHLGISVLEAAELETDLDPTPLWFYILKESELGGGTRLGPVGGVIVAEVLLGLLQHDPNSWVELDPSWRPTLPRHADERFTLGGLVHFATT